MPAGNVRRPCGHRINGVDVTAGKVWGILVLFLGLGTFARADAKTPSSAGAGGAQGERGLLRDVYRGTDGLRIDTVYVASKRAQRLEETPASATVVTAEEIRLYGYRTLARDPAEHAGVYLSYDRMLQYMGTRGFQRPGGLDSRILVLIDGHRMSDNIAGRSAGGMNSRLTWN
jgi:outer membrane receptor protein involved in Fe transport